MCLSSWGRSTYTRALIEVSAENELMESLVIVIPVGKDKGHTLATIDIEYEWKPLRCSTCMIFDHTTNKCPKLPKEVLVTNGMDEGFVEVKKKKHKNKSRPQHQIDGIRLTKPPPKMYYRRVEKGESSESNAIHKTDMEGKEDDLCHDSMQKHDDVLNVSDSKVDEEILVEEQDSTTSGSSIDISMHEFHECVKDIEVSRFHMYRVVKKLKHLKKPFRKLLYEKGNLHANVIRLRTELDSIQTLLYLDPFNANLREAEAACAEGDSNSAYFHKAVKIRVSRSRINAVTNTKGVAFENNVVPDVFVSHYETFLGLVGKTSGFNIANLFKTCLNEQVASDMVRNVTAQEVKEALFSMGNDKSPGPDGYTAAFFKEAWDVVANDVTNAICEFFRNGTLLKELNHTIIALILKVKSPTRFKDSNQPLSIGVHSGTKHHG
ncbi:hypothetical protein Tco_1250874 [Tanacetum coccineum]